MNRLTFTALGAVILCLMPLLGVSSPRIDQSAETTITPD